jgi:uncharacterized membrane protein HdeD (DUF308 family)
MYNYQLWINSLLSYISIIVAYSKFYGNHKKNIDTISTSFGLVCGITMILNGICRGLYYFSKNQPVKWSRSVAFLNISIGGSILYSVFKHRYEVMMILLNISGAWFIFEAFRIFFVYHTKLKISPASPVLLSNLIFGISLVIFANKYKIEDS